MTVPEKHSAGEQEVLPATPQKQSSFVSRLSKHPMSLVVVPVLLGLGGTALGSWYQARQSTVNEASFKQLQEQVATLTHQRDDLAKKLKAEAEVPKADSPAVQPNMSNSIVETFSVLSGAYSGMMNRGYIVAVDSIASGIATTRLRDMSGLVDTVYMKTGNYINLDTKGKNCVLIANEVSKDSVSFGTQCVDAPNRPDTIDFRSTSDYLKAAGERIATLEKQMDSLTRDKEAVEKDKASAEARLNSANAKGQADETVERITVPDGQYVSIMRHEYILLVNNIDGDVAEVSLKGYRSLSDDKLFLTRDTQFVRSTVDGECKVLVNEVRAKIVTITTSCTQAKSKK